MSPTRREVLKAGLGAAVLAAVPRPLLARFGAGWEPVPPIQDPRVRDLALRAVEAARAAGATYADVRLTHTRRRRFALPLVGHVQDREQMGVGVRAMVAGYWGYASSPVWDVDEMARLGREATRRARDSAMGPARPVDLAAAPVVTDGHWTMPVEIDPFEVSPYEIVDHLQSLSLFATRRPRVGVPVNWCEFEVQEKAFASTEGSYCSQRRYRSEGQFVVGYQGESERTQGALDLLTPAGVGWELYRGQPMYDEIERLIERLEEDLTLPLKAVEVGRYDLVCDAWSVARLVDRTLGRATELDRALGFEANAGGTSFLDDPLAMLGELEVAAPALTLSANRSERGGAATIAWDDEGVRPDDFTLVRDGVVTDYQTTRESASWIAEYYARNGRPARSHGCASAPSALELPLQRTPNLAIAPGPEALDFDGAVAGVDRGIAVRQLDVDMDFQGLNGLGLGAPVYEIKAGKRVARIVGSGLLFRAPELWKSLLALGGAESLRRYGTATNKGEPPQRDYHSVTAPPAIFGNVTAIDVMRKA